MKNDGVLSLMEITVSRNNTIKRFLILLILYVQIFEYALFKASSDFKVIDEVIAAISLLYIIYLFLTTSSKRFVRHEGCLILCLTAIILIGLTSNYLFKYQTLKAAAADMIIFAKPIFAYFLSRFLLCDIDLNTLKKPIITFCKLSSVVLFVAVLLNVFTGIFPVYSDQRFFLYSQELFFGHPTYLGSTCIVLICLMIGMRDYTEKSNIIYILLTMLVSLVTFRYKILVFLLFCPLLIYYSLKKRQINKLFFIVIIVVGFLFSYQQIKYYYVSNSSFARSVLTVTSINIANDFFPVGTGFATFGSYQSGVYYSPVYHKYGIDRVWGISKSYPKFISDTFWPMLIGQFGYLGLMFFIFYVAFFFSLISKLRQLNLDYYYSALACLIYLLISSTAESSFVQPYAVLFFYIIGAYISQLEYYSDYLEARSKQIPQRPACDSIEE